MTYWIKGKVLTLGASFCSWWIDSLCFPLQFGSSGFSVTSTLWWIYDELLIFSLIYLSEQEWWLLRSLCVVPETRSLQRTFRMPLNLFYISYIQWIFMKHCWARCFPQLLLYIQMPRLFGPLGDLPMWDLQFLETVSMGLAGKKTEEGRGFSEEENQPYF